MTITLSDNRQDMVERVVRAIDTAQCRGREGPYGGYDYGHNTDFYGPAPEGGRYVIRDFRDPASPDYGSWVHQTHDRSEHEAAYKRLTEHHIATAAIEAMQPRIADELAEAAQMVLDGLNARIDHACQNSPTSVPVFTGIAALSDALTKYKEARRG